MFRAFRRLSALFLLAATAAHAGQWQRAQDVAAVARAYAERETQGLPGEVSVTAGNVDSRLRLPACPQPEPFLPAGARLWGNATVGVRCTAPSAWTVYVPVTVKVMTKVVHAARALPRGQVLTEGDIEVRPADLTQLQPGVLTDPAQVVGRTLNIGAAAAAALRQDMLRKVNVVQQGQPVRLQAQGRGFSISGEGKAMSNAGEGETVQVRTASGQVVKGIARAGGVVEIQY